MEEPSFGVSLASRRAITFFFEGAQKDDVRLGTEHRHGLAWCFIDVWI